MLEVKRKIGFALLAVMLMPVLASISGCSGSDLPPPNAPGAEANTKKVYTPEEAAAAKPKRNGSQ